LSKPANATHKKQHIEKFKGKFEDVKGGCTVSINKTIQSLTDVYELAFYSYLSSKPQDWEIHHKELMSHFDLGKNKVYRVLNGLMEKRLIKKIEERDKGMFTGIEYQLYLQPFPLSSDTVTPFPLKGDTYKEKKLPYKEKNEKKDANASLTYKNHNPAYQDYVKRIEADRMLGLPSGNTDILVYADWLKSHSIKT